MEKLAELLMPYCKKKETAIRIAEALSKQGVMVGPRNGTLTCKFPDNHCFGTLTIDGEEIPVYLSAMRREPIGGGRDLMTDCFVPPIKFLRRFTLIEM